MRVRLTDIHPRDAFFFDRDHLIGLTGDWQEFRRPPIDGYHAGTLTVPGQTRPTYAFVLVAFDVLEEESS